MPAGRPVAPVVLSDGEKNQLLSITRSHSQPHGIVRPARIVLAAAAGKSNPRLPQTWS